MTQGDSQFFLSLLASALEVIFETVIEIWNYSVLKYDLPLSCITINETNEETRNTSNATIDELLQITENLIDFSQEEIVVQNLTQIGEPNGDNVSGCSDILTPLKELACTLNNEAIKQSSFENQNDVGGNHAILVQDDAKQRGKNLSTDLNGENYQENVFKDYLNHDNGDSSYSSDNGNCSYSSDLLKETEVVQTTSTIDVIPKRTFMDERDIDCTARNRWSELRNEIISNGKQSEVNLSSTQDVCIKTNKILPDVHQEITLNKMAAYALDNLDCWHVAESSESSLEYLDNSMNNKKLAEDTTIQIIQSDASNVKSFNNKQRRVQFSEEVQTFIYEPGKNVHHPCVILKSPIAVTENKDKYKNCQSTFIIEEVEETSYHSYVIREQEKEITSVYRKNPDILETMGRAYAGRPADDNNYLSDESDTSDASFERQNRIESWLQLANEDNKFLLDNVYPIYNCSSKHKHRKEDCKTSKTEHGNIRFNKAVVRAARKQSKEILDRICKKLFQQKSVTRK
ncbi:hypothetical protein HNY73_000856 [Argiope bruennichi]|uniref:Uncharacterized protein n=1 Tax=Argiope bruennichi TaxID=94029 RepID=A0A8T0G0P5_ARGBR|nr:hypothetical protein HNY73_000856 [Argiope bruennichi]